MKRALRGILFRIFGRMPLFLARFRRMLTRQRELPPEPRSFLIVRFDAMGDLVLTTPLFRDLKQSFPQSTIAVVTHSAFRTLIENNPFVDQILTLPPIRKTPYMTDARLLWAALKLFFGQVRKQHYDYAISPRWDADMHPANLLCLLAPARRTVGFPDRAKMRMDFPFKIFGDMFDITVPGDGVMHEVLRGRSIVSELGGISSNLGPEVFSLPEHERKAAELLRKAPAETLKLAIGIGAQAPFRRWPLENYAQVLRELTAQRNVYPVIVCGPSEVEQASQMVKMLPMPSCIVAESDLRVTASVLKQCAIFIGNDSGPAHLAAASGCAMVVISPHPVNGDPNHANSPIRFSPYCQQCIVLQPNIARAPCRTHCMGDTPHCILGILPDMVVESMLKLMDQRFEKLGNRSK